MRMSGSGHSKGSSDLANVVASITQDIERLHSLIAHQRLVLHGSTHEDSAARSQARQQLQRIRASAAQVADRAREAIKQVSQTA